MGCAPGGGRRSHFANCSPRYIVVVSGRLPRQLKHLVLASWLLPFTCVAFLLRRLVVSLGVALCVSKSAGAVAAVC
eukprot:14273866-Alexandrium_andersonii.AAC.1